MSSQNLDPLTNGSYWGPQEPPAAILFEDLYLIGIYFQTMATTAQFILYCICMKILWKDHHRRKRPYLLMLYSSFLCATNVIIFAVSCLNLRLAYIDNRNFPDGGVIAYISASAGLPNNVLGITALVVGNIAADLLLLYRCNAIWSASFGGNSKRTQWIMILPVIVFLASAGTGLLFDIRSSVPGGFLPTTIQRIGLAYFTLSLGLNLILTGLIMWRLWSYKKVIAASLGKEHGRHYSSITTMFVESAALYTLSSIPVLVSFALSSPYNQVWLSISPAMQLICSYFIIWRVADGRAMSKDTFASSMVFNTPNNQTAYSSNPTVGGSRYNINGSKYNVGNTIQLSPIKTSNQNGVMYTTETSESISEKA